MMTLEELRDKPLLWWALLPPEIHRLFLDRLAGRATEQATNLIELFSLPPIDGD